MSPKKRKRLKWQKIALVGVVVALMLITTLPIGAIYISGDANSLRYSAPLRFDIEVFGTTTELTPTITLGTPPTDTVETAYSDGSNIGYIRKKDFTISSLATTACEVTYNLKLNSTTDLETFVVRVTSGGGVYDFGRYGIPQIAIPYGYAVDYDISYMTYYTQEQSDYSRYMDIYEYNGAYQMNGSIELLRDETPQGNPLLGRFGISNYVATLTFHKVDSGEEIYPPNGGEGWYTWNNVLTIDPDTIFAEILYNTTYFGFTFGAPCYLYAYIGDSDTLETLDFYGLLLIERDGWSNWEMQYEIPPDQTYVVYDGDYDRWYAIEHGVEDAIEDMVIVPVSSVRTIYMVDDFENTFFSGGFVVDDPDAYEGVPEDSIIGAFRDWFKANTSYSTTNPLFEGSTPLTNTNGGGILVRYYTDSLTEARYNETFSGLYNNGVAHGTNTDVGVFDWLTNAVGGLFSLELMPNFSLGTIIGTIIAIMLALVFLKIWAGG